MKMLVLLMFLVSCATPKDQPEPWPSNSVTYSFGANFGGFEGISSGQAKEAFREAAKVWSNAGGLELVEANKGQIVIVKADLVGRVAGRAHYPANGGQIRMDSSRLWTVKLFCKVAMHEFGHAIGLAHADSKSSIMYYKTGKVSKPSRYDLERLRRVYR
mgnify:CR=1 FL=1